MVLTGRNVHQAFASAFPRHAFDWSEISESAKDTYEAVAGELNKMLAIDPVFCEKCEVEIIEDISIEAIKCPTCSVMLSDLKNHPCLEMQ